jgi:hypothetical protein
MTNDPTTSTPSSAPPAEAAPATPAAVPASGLAGRARWLIAGGAVVVAVAIIAGAALLLGGRPVPEALTYIPADSAVVAELRLDLPGDQLQKVGNLLAHFPGFKDQSTLPQKLDEALTRITTSATKGSVDYDKQLKPWLAGPTFAAGSAHPGLPMEIPSPGPTSSGAAAAFAARPGLIVATTDGTATCASLFSADQSPVTSTYQGVAVLATTDMTRACAMNGRIGIIGSLALVKAALDAHAAHNGMDTTTAYRTARDTLGGDRLATVFVSKAAMLSGAGSSTDLGSLLPSASFDLETALASVPDWAISGISAEDDALVGDLVTAPVTLPTASAADGSPLPTLPPAHASRTAVLLPANTVALVDVHGAGIALRTALARLGATGTPGTTGPSGTPAPPLDQVTKALAALGGPDALVGWVDDAAVAVVPDGTGATGGLVLLGPDATTAAAKVAQLKSLITLAGLGGGQVQAHDETVGGTTMTVVDLGDLGALLNGATGGTGDTLPIPAGTHLTIAFAAKGSAVIAGGDAFVRATLNVQPGASLADSAPYKHAIGRAAAENLGELYVGTGSLLTLADTLIPEAARASFDTDTKPYLEPFDAILVTTSLEHGGAHVRLVATVQ